jgi:hypothetical protein
MGVATHSWRLIVVAAVVVAPAVGCGDDDDTGSAAATAPASVVTSLADPRLPRVGCCSAEPIDAGRYALPSGYEPFTAIVVPDGWLLTNEQAARYLAFGQGTNEVGTPSRLVALYRGAAADRDAMLAAIVASTELEILASDNATGVVDARALPNPGYEGSPSADIAGGTQRLPALSPLVAQGFALTTSTPEARLRFSLRTQGDLLLVAVVEAPAPEFDAFVADADELLAGLLIA